MVSSAPRVLLTATAYPPSVGGAQLHAHRLAATLHARGDISCHVATQWTTHRTDWLLGTTVRAPLAADRYELDDIAVHPLASSWGLRLRSAPWAAMYYALQGPAVAHLSDLILEQLEQVPGAIDLVHNVRIGRPPLSEASYKLARRRGVPFVFAPLHHPRWVGWPYGPYLDLYRRADALLALTEVERQTLVQLGVDERRICVTGIGPIVSDPSRASGARFRARHGIAPDAPLVLFLGQKYRYKGIEALVRAAPHVWREHADTHFVFVGPRTDHSRQIFAGGQDARIHDLDAVPLEEKTDALAASDLLCVPSEQESFGGVYTEAWQLGKPVIGGPAPAIREVIEHGVDGLVVSQDADSIARSIVRLLSDADERRAMGARGRAKVEERFTWDRIADRLLACYQSLLR